MSEILNTAAAVSGRSRPFGQSSALHALIRESASPSFSHRRTLRPGQDVPPWTVIGGDEWDDEDEFLDDEEEDDDDDEEEEDDDYFPDDEDDFDDDEEDDDFDDEE